MEIKGLIIEKESLNLGIPGKLILVTSDFNPNSIFGTAEIYKEDDAIKANIVLDYNVAIETIEPLFPIIGFKLFGIRSKNGLSGEIVSLSLSSTRNSDESIKRVGEQLSQLFNK